MQKRLFGILASIAVIAAACGGASTTSAPPASTAPGQSASAETPAPSVSDLADQQILKIDLGQEPPTGDPNKAQDSTSIAVLHALHRGLLYFDKDNKVVPELAAALPEVGNVMVPNSCDAPGGFGRLQDPDLHSEGRDQVQQWRPDRRR